MAKYSIPDDELYRVITQYGLVGTWGLRLADEAAFLSPGIYEIYDLPLDYDLPLAEGISFYHEEDRPELQAAIGNAVENGEKWDLEVRIISAKNELKWVRTMGNPVLEDGRAVEIRGVLLDITEQKKSKATIKDLNVRSRLALSSNQIGVWDWDLRGKDIIWDNQMYRIFGYNPENAPPPVPEIWEKALHPEDKERMDAEIENAFATGNLRARFRILHPNGDLHYLQGDGVVVRDDDGNPLRMVGINWDVTELVGARQSAEKALSSVVGVLSRVLELRDPFTAGHQQQTGYIATTIARAMNLSEDKIECIAVASEIHDIGKIQVPAEILNKPTRLSNAEMLMVQEHPRTGYDLVKDIEFPWPVAKVILQHHERLDGTGYPNGLQGKDIMLEARILAVADVLESMTSRRPFRGALPLSAALEELKAGWATKYDAAVLDTCLSLLESGELTVEESNSFNPQD